MTEPALAAQQAETLAGPMPFGQLLAETLRLYQRHGLAFTRRLLAPVALIYLGGYACLYFNFQVIDQMVARDPMFVNRHPVMAFGSVGLICLVTMGLFCRGFWHYMVYWASLNLNAAEAIENRPVDFKAAFNRVGARANAYALLLVAYCLLPLVAVVPFWLFQTLGARMDLSMQVVMTVAGLGLSAVAGLLTLVGLIFLSLIFQVAAFEPIGPNPLAIFRRSARLVWPVFWQATALQVMLYLVTNYAVPLPLWGLVRLLHADSPLNATNQWLVARYLDWAPPPPQMAMLTETITRDIPGLAADITGMLLMTVVVSLLLPLGTFAFTLLYREALRK